MRERLNKSPGARVKAKFQTGERREKIFFFLRARDARAFLFVRKTHSDTFKRTFMGKARLALQSKRILEFLFVQKTASSDSKGVIMDPDCLNSARFSRT